MIGTAAMTAVSVVRPPSTMSAPACSAAAYGSGPIKATMRSQPANVAGSTPVNGASGVIRPAAARSAVIVGDCSE